MNFSREAKVGLFIFSSALLLAAAMLYLAVEKGVFEKMHVFTLSSPAGDGFTQGMPVVFSGFDIGQVQSLELNEEGLVLIKIKIPDRHVKWIRQKSDFILYRPLIGSASIVVETEDLKSPPLDENTIPEVYIINDINDAIAKIEPVLEKVTQIAENVERLTKNLSDPKGDLNLAISNAEKITSRLAGKKSLVEMAVSDEESVKAMYDSLKKLKDIALAVEEILKKIDKMAQKTDGQLYDKEGILPQANLLIRDVLGKLQKLDKTVDNINKISTEASSGMEDISILRSNIDDVVNSLDNTVKKLEAIIGAKKPPEFKKP